MLIRIAQAFGNDLWSQTKCGDFTYLPADNNPKLRKVEGVTISLSSEEVLYLSSVYDDGNKGFSVQVRDKESSLVFLATCSWDKIAPHFSFLSPSRIVVQLYFEK